MNYEALEHIATEILHSLKLEITGVLGFIYTNVPFAGGFLTGFLLGLKKG